MTSTINNPKVSRGASKSKTDEYYTPAYGVEPLLEYIPKNAVVWCPFDKKDSEFVKQISRQGNEVVFSHIDFGQDFLSYEPAQKYDMIISNPPFSLKTIILKRCLALGKPFAILTTAMWFNDAMPFNLYTACNKDLQVLWFDKRMQFDSRGKIPFKSIYLCCDFLPQGNVVKKLNTKRVLNIF